MGVYGPNIIARTIENAKNFDQHGNVWQYSSRSDHHSKVACWAIAFDFLRESSVLRGQAQALKVTLGVNHKMTNFETGKPKKLDLVIARPATPVGPRLRSLGDYGEKWQILLDREEQEAFAQLPAAFIAPVGSVLVALEAKACMTAHTRALPRLYDELNSSHTTVHGASNQALAVGFAMINASSKFASSDLNRRPLGGNPPAARGEPQPISAERALQTVTDIPRRSGAEGAHNGFDALGALIVHMENRGGPVTLATHPDPGPFSYEALINRLVHEYENSFRHI